MRILLLVFLLAAAAVAQQAPPPSTTAQSLPALDPQQLCVREFGDNFKLDTKFAPLTVDLDGDGLEDLVMVATTKNPLAGEAEYHYRAIDPYDAYFGWGYTRDTVQFSKTNVGAVRYVLVVHNWRAPKAKFVILNLPFDTLSVARVTRGKKTVNSIHAVETGILGANVYWNGKKYKWEPGATEDE